MVTRSAHSGRTRHPSDRAVFRAISDPTRRAMLDALSRQPTTVTALAQRFPISRPAVSKHLRALRLAGLVEIEARGRTCMVHLNPAPLSRVDDWITRQKLGWAAALVRLKEHVEHARRRIGPTSARSHGVPS